MKAGLLIGGGLAAAALIAFAGASTVGHGNVTEGAKHIAGELDDWLSTLLKKTSAHEGKYWSVQRNLDGQGVSYGILQWTQKGGGLGRVLARMYDTDPIQFRSIFGPASDELLAKTAAASLEPVAGVELWKDPWLGRFDQAGRYVPFQRAQDIEAGDSDYLKAAVQIAGLLGVKTERAMVMYFNRTVHQGAAGALGPARVMADWYAADPSRRPAQPNDVLAQYAWRCAAKFRRTTPPDDEAYSKDGVLRWKSVGSEWSELRTGDYRVSKVAVTVPTWHVFPGGFPTSLYDLITKRSSEILLDPTLRDQDVNLARVGSASERPVVSGIPPLSNCLRYYPGGRLPNAPQISGLAAFELRARA